VDSNGQHKSHGMPGQPSHRRRGWLGLTDAYANLPAAATRKVRCITWCAVFSISLPIGDGKRPLGMSPMGNRQKFRDLCVKSVASAATPMIYLRVLIAARARIAAAFERRAYCSKPPRSHGY
jgi:hypothetical protein